MPAQPPNLQQTDNRIPCKCQARLDDNGKPAGVPASKNAKSAGKNGPKKKKPHQNMNRTKKNHPFQNSNHGSTGSQKKNHLLKATQMI